MIVESRSIMLLDRWFYLVTRSDYSLIHLHAASIHEGDSAASGWTNHWVDFGAVTALEVIVGLLAAICTSLISLFVRAYGRYNSCLVHAKVLNDMRRVVVEAWLRHLPRKRIDHLYRLARIVWLSFAHWHTDILSILGMWAYLYLGRFSSSLGVRVVTIHHMAQARWQLWVVSPGTCRWTPAVAVGSSSIPELALNDIDPDQDVVGGISSEGICLCVVLDQG